MIHVQVQSHKFSVCSPSWPVCSWALDRDEIHYLCHEIQQDYYQKNKQKPNDNLINQLKDCAK